VGAVQRAPVKKCRIWRILRLDLQTRRPGAKPAGEVISGVDVLPVYTNPGLRLAVGACHSKCSVWRRWEASGTRDERAAAAAGMALSGPIHL
jgi:hypothetical protein